MQRYVLLLAACCGVAAWGSESYKPPEGDESWQKATLYLKPASNAFREASGTVVFVCNLAETQHRCQLYAKNLVKGPAARYTLWLVDMEGNKVKSTQEVTSRWRKLYSDKRGVLTFIGNLPRCPAAHDVFVVKYHPPGRRGKFRDGITVLKGYLRKME